MLDKQFKIFSFFLLFIMLISYLNTTHNSKQLGGNTEDTNPDSSSTTTDPTTTTGDTTTTGADSEVTTPTGIPTPTTAATVDESCKIDDVFKRKLQTLAECDTFSGGENIKPYYGGDLYSYI